MSRFSKLSDEKEEKATRCCGTAMSLASLALLVSGVTLVYSADYETVRTALGDKYNAAVVDWTDNHAGPFSETKWELLQNGSGALLMSIEHQVDPLKGNNSVLLNYEPAQFRLRGLQVGGDLSLVHGSPGPILEDGEVILDEDKDPAPKLSIPVVPDMLLPRDIMLRATTAAGGGVGDLPGVAGACAQGGHPHLELEDLPVPADGVVGRGALHYVPVPRGDLRQGAEGGGQVGARQRVWGDGVYPQERVGAGQEEAHPCAATRGDAALPVTPYMGLVTVRSSADPHILVQNLTTGSGVLATTQAEERAFGTIFILIGALLVLPSCFLL
eukprot:CAMPEP_0182893440 /NCGR_PEP_ID=MMETSP0034_2-20130328/24479_1 /TAXON_ID=156128 /ORGANISM="Nephroselmis pyriformis, Strain CCMP717" /LENGTH=327 /DNA_ID=CAMNT_0025027187 /DNA_START=105 /DNA_END=1085 /DNA_ORIENTATION=-